MSKLSDSSTLTVQVGPQNFSKAIQDYVAAMPLSAEVKVELASELALRTYGFYVQLPAHLATLFPGVTPAQLTELTIYSYLYFRYIMNLDGLLDGDIKPSAATAGSIFGYQMVHEYATRGLAKLFPEGSPFWPSFEACKQEYVEACLREKQINAATPAYSRGAFEMIAKGKSAVCFALVYAMCSLGQDWQHEKDLVDCLALIHTGEQYFDDLLDFRPDMQNGQYTYAHAQLEAHLRSINIDPATVGEELQGNFLYTSGVAVDLLERGRELLTQAQSIAQRLSLPAFVAYTQAQLIKSGKRQQNISDVVARTRDQVQSVTPAAQASQAA
jgi:hypothetical protein